MLSEVLAVLEPRPGELAVDCTLGAGGHAVELVRGTGCLVAFDLDPGNIELAKQKLTEFDGYFKLHHANFAGLAAYLPESADVVLADLGVSSMQIDDPDRGFSYRRDGPLDLRMDPTRGTTAAQLLTKIMVDDLAKALEELGDYSEFGPSAARNLAEVIQRNPPATTATLTELILNTVPAPKAPAGKNIKPWQLKYRPVACAFQTIRILVNRELANLAALLRALPEVLRPGGRAAIITFHSGEDRLVKQAFRAGMRDGTYETIADDPIRPSAKERFENPRSRSAKLRWAKRSASHRG